MSQNLTFQISCAAPRTFSFGAPPPITEADQQLLNDLEELEVLCVAKKAVNPSAWATSRARYTSSFTSADTKVRDLSCKGPVSPTRSGCKGAWGGGETGWKVAVFKLVALHQFWYSMEIFEMIEYGSEVNSVEVAGWGGRTDSEVGGRIWGRGGSKRRRRKHRREHERGEGRGTEDVDSCFASFVGASFVQTLIFTLLHSASFKVGVFIFAPSSNVLLELSAAISPGANVWQNVPKAGRSRCALWHGPNYIQASTLAQRHTHMCLNTCWKESQLRAMSTSQPPGIRSGAGWGEGDGADWVKASRNRGFQGDGHRGDKADDEADLEQAPEWQRNCAEALLKRE